ncbi:ATP-binding protein [Candidatus Azambacteria bacterium]|nr:ATP-binding protein [Candidatus Azambacteria bacterium]
MWLHRVQEEKIHNDLLKKMVFIVGPRQVGKTWLAKKIMERYGHSLYLNYDSIEDRTMMETFRKTGDSLAGRFFVHHLLPLSLSELKDDAITDKVDRLIERSGFPEPFLVETREEAARWRKLYTDSLVREDIINFETVTDIKALYNVFEILRRSVGSPVSFSNIARDVGISPVTVKKYISVLESLYIIFSIRTFSAKIKRSILKESKIYFYDTGLVIGDQGVVFENFVALSLLKDTELRNDMQGANNGLYYLRTKEGKEADFVLVNSMNEPQKMIEVKYSDILVSKNLLYFKNKYGIPAVQLVKNMSKVGFIVDGVSIFRAEEFLTDINN